MSTGMCVFVCVFVCVCVCVWWCVHVWCMYVWCVYVVIYIVHNMYGVCWNMRCVCTLKKLDEMEAPNNTKPSTLNPKPETGCSQEAGRNGGGEQEDHVHRDHAVQDGHRCGRPRYLC